MTKIEEEFVAAFRRALEQCSLVTDAFYDSFDFTTTGNNRCHPRTVGLIAKACWSLPGVEAVDMDCRFNLGGGVKFQPDIACTARDGQPVLFVDFESPNSSDARIPEKDVKAFCQWCRSSGRSAPYFIVTCLPKRPRNWELRWTAAGKWNEGHGSRGDAILRSPFDYWYGHYRRTVDAALLDRFPVRFLNLEGKHLEEVDLRVAN